MAQSAKSVAKGLGKAAGALGAGYGYGAVVKIGAFPSTWTIFPNWLGNLNTLLNPTVSAASALTFGGLVTGLVLGGASEGAKSSTARTAAKIISYGIMGAIGVSMLQTTIDPPLAADRPSPAQLAQVQPPRLVGYDVATQGAQLRFDLPSAYDVATQGAQLRFARVTPGARGGAPAVRAAPGPVRGAAPQRPGAIRPFGYIEGTPEGGGAGGTPYQVDYSSITNPGPRPGELRYIF